MINKVWCEKYRPKELKQLIADEHLHDKLQGYIDAGEIPNLLFTGTSGTGKTSIASILANNIECDSIFLNGSDDNSIDVMRNRIKNFCSTVGFNKFKLVVINEADYLSVPAQSAFRGLIEEFYDHARFILTANYPEKLIEPIRSRFQEIIIKPSRKDDIVDRAFYILKKENIKIEDEDSVYDLVDATYPDMRKLIESLNKFSVKGVFKIDEQKLYSNNQQKIIKAIEDKKDFNKVRQLIVNCDAIEYSSMYRMLFDSVHIFSREPRQQNEMMLHIAEYMYRDNFVVDKEINLSACILKILSLQ